MPNLPVKSKNDLYKIAVDGNESLETRWEALRRFRSNKIHNPLLGDLDIFIIENSGLVHMVSIILQTTKKINSAN
ncbi:hypothetical protein PMSD_06040 [Paenibacillus macquariensis subsp. defensor]|nr:hypothetical protein PMSD_06040 [Paenibacillus macquariensis subsp. defensor]